MSQQRNDGKPRESLHKGVGNKRTRLSFQFTITSKRKHFQEREGEIRMYGALHVLKNTPINIYK